MMEDVILFGTGKYYKHKFDAIKKYRIIAILDNRIPKGNQEKSIETGAIIHNPTDIALEGSTKVFLMAMNFVSMWKQLVQIGVQPERIVYPFYEKPYFQSDEVVNEMVDQILFSKDSFTVLEKNGSKRVLRTQEEWNEYLRELYRRKHTIIDTIAELPFCPVSEQFGTERGTPVDRIYIDKFLSRFSSSIKGDVVEIEDSIYTYKFGSENVKKSYIIDVSDKSKKIDFNANIETGVGVKENLADCFIITQTLMYIYDLEAAAKNIIRFLKPGGTALITCSGLSQNSKRCMENYGAYFNFNSTVFEKMFESENAEIVETGSYGNVKTVMAHLVGMCAEDLRAEDFEIDDKCYPLIVYAVVRKNGE